MKDERRTKKYGTIALYADIKQGHVQVAFGALRVPRELTSLAVRHISVFWACPRTFLPTSGCLGVFSLPRDYLVRVPIASKVVVSNSLFRRRT